MKTSRSISVLGAIACSLFAVATFAGCADDNTTAGGTCKGDPACCSQDKPACSSDKAACCHDAKTTDTKTQDGMNK
jgi:hypothetical protein